MEYIIYRDYAPNVEKVMPNIQGVSSETATVDIWKSSTGWFEQLLVHYENIT